MSSNYNVFSTVDNIGWPEYVSERELVEKELLKAAHVLDMALVTLEAYEGPNYHLVKLHKAIRKCLYLYEIYADLSDSSEEVHECRALILYEPWMKANCIAQATFEFADDETESKIVIKRKKSVRYYKNHELLYDYNEVNEESSNIPKIVMQHTSV